MQTNLLAGVQEYSGEEEIVGPPSVEWECINVKLSNVSSFFYKHLLLIAELNHYELNIIQLTWLQSIFPNSKRPLLRLAKVLMLKLQFNKSMYQALVLEKSL